MDIKIDAESLGEITALVSDEAVNAANAAFSDLGVRFGDAMCNALTAAAPFIIAPVVREIEKACKAVTDESDPWESGKKYQAFLAILTKYGAGK
jgi:hypothetical protein